MSLTKTHFLSTNANGLRRHYRSSYRDVIRAKIILYAAQGLSNDVIASRLDLARQILSKRRKRFSSISAWRGSKSIPEAGGLPAFPLSVIVELKALACELPSRLGLPLSRLSLFDIRNEVLAQGVVAQISGSTLRRWLSSDAIRPW